MKRSSILRRIAGASVSVAIVGSVFVISAPCSAAADTSQAATEKSKVDAAEAKLKSSKQAEKSNKNGKSHSKVQFTTISVNGLALFDMAVSADIPAPALGFPQTGVVIDNFQNGFQFLEAYAAPGSNPKDAYRQLKQIDAARAMAVNDGDTGVTIDAPAADLSLGDTVDANSVYNSDDSLALLYGDGAGNFTPGTTGTLGFEYLLNGETEYGYARIAISAKGNAARVIGGAAGVSGGAIGVAGVPEPATWLMMICGVGLTGAALRARRRTVAATA